MIRGWEKINKARKRGYEFRTLKRNLFFRELGIISRFLAFFGFKKSYESTIRSLKGKYEGQRCFVVGNGPSIREMDLTSLKDEITIGFNGIYKSKDRFGWYPTFFLSQDREVLYKLSLDDEFKKMTTRKFISLDNAYLDLGKDCVYFNMDNTSALSKKIRSFSNDFASIAFNGWTISYTGLQFAYYLGFSEIYLLGFDHGHGKKFHEKHGKSIKKIVLDQEDHELLAEVYGSKDYPYIQVGEVYTTLDLEIVEESYKIAKLYFDTANIKVLNAGIKSDLDVFEKVDFNSILKK